MPPPSPSDVAPQVAIVIVSYRSQADIAACLTALEKSTWTKFRIVICENGGEMAWQTAFRLLPTALAGGQSVEILKAPSNLGYAGGINFAIGKTAPADAYWILNPDTRPMPDALQAMLERLGRGDCTAIGHDLIDEDGRLGSRGGRWRAWSARAISIGKGQPRGADMAAGDAARLEASIDYIVGASMLVSRDFLQRTGPMREDYFLYCEEVEWCLRAVRRGEKLGYAPGAVVVHAQGTSTGGGGGLATRSKTSVYLAERSRILLTRDLYPGRLPAAALLMLLHVLIRYGKAGAWRQMSYAISGWLAGLRNERGKPGWLENGVAAGADA
jgi:GT2 family glycosyltransferase